jgi:hypothetical protein
VVAAPCISKQDVHLIEACNAKRRDCLLQNRTKGVAGNLWLWEFAMKALDQDEAKRETLLRKKADRRLRIGSINMHRMSVP